MHAKSDRSGCRWRVIAVAICLLLTAASVGAQSAFPVRLDTPEPAAINSVQEHGAVSLRTATHYMKRLVLDITGADNEILRIDASSNDTTISVVILGSAYTSSLTPLGFEAEATAGGGPSYREVGFAIRKLGAPVELFSRQSTDAPIFHWQTNPGNDVWDLRVDMPTDFEYLTLFIEAVANKPVTFAELF